MEGGKPASTSNSPKFSLLSAWLYQSVCFLRKHISSQQCYATNFCSNSGEIVSFDCNYESIKQSRLTISLDWNFESIMMQHHPNQNSCLSDSVLSLPMNLICGCVWKQPPNQSWIYRTSSQGLNNLHLIMESRKTKHPVTFN